MPSSPPAAAAAWRERAKGFAEKEVRPLAESIDRTDRLPEQVVHAMAAQGFLGLTLPESWEGQGGDTRTLVAVLEELSRASAAVAVTMAVHLSVCAVPILEHGSEPQKDRYLRPLARGELVGAFALSEPNAGSDTARIATRYARDGSAFVLHGTKMFISNALFDGVTLVFATSDPALGHRGISAFLLAPNTPGASVAQRLDKMGLRGNETAELVLDRARLPADSLLGEEGRGLSLALGALSGGRVGIAACALGVADAAFEEMWRAVRESDADWKRTRLARAFAELSAARALVDRAAERKDAGASYIEEGSVAKLVASRAALSIASAGIDVAGPNAVRAGAPAERLLRDARVFPIVEGTAEIQELILARRLLEGADERNV